MSCLLAIPRAACMVGHRQSWATVVAAAGAAETNKLEDGLQRTRLQLATLRRSCAALAKRLEAAPHLDLRIAHLKAQVGTTCCVQCPAHGGLQR